MRISASGPRAAAAVVTGIFGCPVILLSGAPAQAAFPGGNGLVAFSNTVFGADPPNDGVNAVFTVRADGTGRTRLTFTGNSDSPRWGPGGRHVLYAHGNQIWVMDAYGHHQRQLTTQSRGQDMSPAWAPRAQRMVFTRFTGAPGDQDLMIYTFATRTLRALHVGAGFDRIPVQPAWSPDGSLIVFSATSKAAGTSTQEPQWDLFTVHPDGTGLTRLTDTPHVSEQHPNWSPDGGRLVFERALFTSHGTFCEGLDVMDADARNRHPLHAGCSALGPAWSPDGRHILAYLGKTTHPGLWMMDPTGGHQRFIASGGSGDWQPLR